MEKKVFVSTIMNNIVVRIQNNCISYVGVNVDGWSSEPRSICRRVCQYNQANNYNDIPENMNMFKLVFNEHTSVPATEFNVLLIQKSIKKLATEWYNAIEFPVVAPNGDYKLEDLIEVFE